MCAALRAERSERPSGRKNWACSRALAQGQGGNFQLPSHPTEAALSLAWSFGNHFRKHSESWCPLDAPKLGGDLGFLTKMGGLEIGPETTDVDHFFNENRF